MCQRPETIPILKTVMNSCEKMNTKENSWTVTVSRRRTSQKTDVKKMGRREDQDEEDKKEIK